MELLQKAINHFDDLKNKNKDKDNGDIFAQFWAISFKQLCKEQLYAKKTIDEILILAQLKQLTLNVVPSISPVAMAVYHLFSPVHRHQVLVITIKNGIFIFARNIFRRKCFAASAPKIVNPPIYFQCVQDLIRDTKFS